AQQSPTSSHKRFARGGFARGPARRRAATDATGEVTEALTQMKIRGLRPSTVYFFQ
ncbi:unnamed protein product, partial [Effrenium voratum]